MCIRDRLITFAGMDEGKEVAWVPSYGPEMRGGTANCSVTVSDEPIGSHAPATVTARRVASLAASGRSSKTPS